MTDLAAWLNRPHPPARDWPTPAEPDHERGDRGGDDWSRNRDYELPIGWPR